MNSASGQFLFSWFQFYSKQSTVESLVATVFDQVVALQRAHLSYDSFNVPAGRIIFQIAFSAGLSRSSAISPIGPRISTRLPHCPTARIRKSMSSGLKVSACDGERKNPERSVPARSGSTSRIGCLGTTFREFLGPIMSSAFGTTKQGLRNAIPRLVPRWNAANLL